MENFPEILNVVKYVAHSIPTYQLLILILNPRCANERAIHIDYRLLIRPVNICYVAICVGYKTVHHCRHYIIRILMNF